jgi:hypothetical protein
MNRQQFKKTTITTALSLMIACSALLPTTFAAEEEQATEAPSASLTLDKLKSSIRDEVKFYAEGLDPDTEVNLVWTSMQGSYQLKGIYSFIKPNYELKESVLLSGTSDSDGVWEGTFKVPAGFGGDHTLYVREDETTEAQTNLYVGPTFRMSPESGPVGTEITIEAEGIGWADLESTWQLTYDNHMTGMISAISTNGSAVAKIRAAGPVGDHSLTVWHGYLGMPYINHEQAPNSYLPVPHFTFEVTDGRPPVDNYVEPVPKSAAGGGVQMPELVNKEDVKVQLSQDSGIVNNKVTLTASGLPPGEQVQINWNTMVGSRVTAAGFSESAKKLTTLTSDDDGDISYEFRIPVDLGGVPHRIDVKIGDDIYGQAYYTIHPSIVSMTPTSGPAGTAVSVEIQGVGWTEYDNAYYLTYDNSYIGYMCGFNSQGDVKFTINVTGEPGYHILDLYPGIYRGQKQNPNIYVTPQLTYDKDHPGSAIPAIRMGFQITDKDKDTEK